MLNCKIRFTQNWLSMGIHTGDIATFINGFLHYPNGYVGKTAYFGTYDFRALNPVAKFEVIEMEGKPVKIKDHPDFKNDALPRICYVLGGEKTPLKPFEHFNISGHECFLTEKGDIVDTTFLSVPIFPEWIVKMFEDPSEIIRRPQFSDDEKAQMRLLIGMGFPWLARDGDQYIMACSDKPRECEEACFVITAGDASIVIPDETFPQITYENSPFDCKAYLESEESK